MPRKKAAETAGSKPHPLDGTFAYFDSELEIKVGPITTIIQDGRKYRGHFTFTGTYSVMLSQGNGRYYWPVIGGTINALPIGGGTVGEPISNMGYELGFVIFSPAVHRGDPTHGNTDLSRFMDAWAGYAGVDPGGRVNNIQLRYLNVTFLPEEPPVSSKDVADQISAALAARNMVRLRHFCGHQPAQPEQSARSAQSAPRKSRGEPLPPVRTAWSAFTWQPTWEDYGARTYIRKP